MLRVCAPCVLPRHAPHGVTCFAPTNAPAQEAAAQRWVEGLLAAEGALGDPSRPAPAPRPHLLLLRKQLLVALVRRVDGLLFRCVGGQGSVWGREGRGWGAAMQRGIAVRLHAAGWLEASTRP